jgi:hypothetical protein
MMIFNIHLPLSVDTDETQKFAKFAKCRCRYVKGIKLILELTGVLKMVILMQLTKLFHGIIQRVFSRKRITVKTTLLDIFFSNFA